MTLAHNLDLYQRTTDVQISQDVTFDTMLLSLNTLKGLKDSGFYKPSPIQLHGIPLGKCGFDLLLEAKSGTGKTAVFSVIALEKLNLSAGLQTVILAPTREIAAQICDVIKQIGSSYQGLIVEVVMGGLPIQDDIKKLKEKVHILVGSPGRLKHLIKDKHVDTSAVRILVLDEADKLSEKSFQQDIHYIFSALPKQKQVIMSSATYPEESEVFISQYVQCAQHICPDSSNVLLGIEQKYTLVKANTNIVKQTQLRFEELLKIFKKKQFKQCLIFCNYQARVGELHSMLTAENWPAEQLYGQQEQTDRLDALRTLQEYKCRVLIATDLAARGIDASNVDLVINFEPPYEWQTYLHRIGRAGRYGSYGVAISILSEGKEHDKFKSLLETLKIPLTVNNLWVNEITNTETSQSPLTSIDDCSKEFLFKSLSSDLKSDKLQDLWNICTDHENDKKNETETFESLCQSFEHFSTQSEILSFNDLVDSFNTKEVTDSKDETTFKPMKFDTNLLKNKIFYLSNLFECPSGKDANFNDYAISSQTETVSVENKKELNHSKKDNKKDIVKKTNENSHIPSNKNEFCMKVTASRKSYPKEHTTIDYLEAEFTNTEEALIRAGLPTCFSSKNDRDRKNETYKNHQNKLTTKVNELDETIRKQYKVPNRYRFASSGSGESLPNAIQQTRHKKRNPSNRLNYDPHHVSSYNHARFDLNSVQNSFQGKMTQHSHRSDYFSNGYYNESHSGSESLDPEYLFWHKQLKQRIKQIEYAIYIQEMSRI